MLDLIPILSYLYILEGNFSIKETEILSYTTYTGSEGRELMITLKNDYIVPKQVSYQFKGFYLTMNKNSTKIRIPILESELKFFHENYSLYNHITTR